MNSPESKLIIFKVYIFGIFETIYEFTVQFTVVWRIIAKPVLQCKYDVQVYKVLSTKSSQFENNIIIK